MAKVAREIVEKRPAEIIEACRKLYKVKSFKEISLKDISRETSLSRPSIYNYFQTKEEIFLAVLEDEYRLWNISLENILKNNEELGVEEFSAKFSNTLKERTGLLKILSMNLYEIEENSRKESLVEFKKEYGKAVELTGLCLKKFFPSLSEEERKEFIFAFFPFMYGLYPYVHPTEKQLDAMMDAGIERLDMDQVETARKFIKDSLYGIVKEEQR